MERHLLHHTEGNERLKSILTTEEKEMCHMLAIKKEEINTNAEMDKKSNESLCSNDNDNSIPFCNILLSKFLDLTPENDLTPVKIEVDTITTSEKCESNAAAQSRYTEPKEKKKHYLHEVNDQTNKLDSCTERQEIRQNYLQNANEEVDIKAINKRKRNAEKQKRYRERKKLQNSELNVSDEHKRQVGVQKRYKERRKNDLQDANGQVDIALIKKRKKHAERQKRYIQRKKLENNELYLANLRQRYAEEQKRLKETDIDAVIIKRKQNAERSKRFREREKMKRFEKQDEKSEVDIEVQINKRKKHAERQKRYMERKKLENDQLYWANKRKRMSEAQKRCRLKKKLKIESCSSD